MTGAEKIARLRAKIAEADTRKLANAKATAQRNRTRARAKAATVAQKFSAHEAESAPPPIVPPSVPEPALPTVQGAAPIAQRTKPAVCGHGLAHAYQLCRICYDFARSQPHTNRLHSSVEPAYRLAAELAATKVPRKRLDGIEPTWRDSDPDAPRGTAYEIRKALNVPNLEPGSLHSEEKAKFADTNDPAVAEHLAGVLVKNLMDSRKAARELRPDLSPADQAIFGHQIANDANVKAAVQREMRKFGLTDDAKSKFFEILWTASLDSSPSNERARLQAWRLLGRGFGLGVETKKQEEPVALPISGLDQGLEKMGLGNVPDQIDPGTPDDTDEFEDGDDGEESE